MSENDRGSFEPHVPCECQRCADLYGDQAEDLSEVEVHNLRAEVARLNDVMKGVHQTMSAVDRSRSEYVALIAERAKELRDLQAVIGEAVSPKVDADISEEAFALRQRFTEGMMAAGQTIVLKGDLEKNVLEEREACAMAVALCNVVEGSGRSVREQFIDAIRARGRK